MGGGEYGEVRPVKRAYAVRGAHRKEGRRPDLGGRVGLVGDSSSAETELLDGTVWGQELLKRGTVGGPLAKVQIRKPENVAYFTIRSTSGSRGLPFQVTGVLIQVPEAPIQVPVGTQYHP